MGMLFSVRRVLAGAVLGTLMLLPAVALGGYREETHATSIEIARLPTFCWIQFEVPGAQGDDFRIRDCGPSANHYCPGLIYLIRGKNTPPKKRPLGLIQHADIDVAYTESGIANYPSCSIREHVEATRSEINHLLRIHGAKPVGSK